MDIENLLSVGDKYSDERDKSVILIVSKYKNIISWNNYQPDSL